MTAKNIRTIVIVLGDNDFGHTFMPLLEGLKQIIEYRGDDLTQDNIKFVINHSIMAYYVGYQHRFGDFRNDLKHLENYLKPRILFNEEAEVDIATKDHDGGAWYLEVQSGTVCSY